MTEARTQVLPGDVIAGKYRVDRVLGAGGMGVVVAATHLQLEQRVALKFLLPALVSQEEVVARFLREARAAVRIHSEHVSRVLDVGTLETGAPYMVMELLEGEDLEQVLARRGPIPAPEAVGYVLEACEAIAEAHSIGIVHRDLKPANLFLARRPNGPPVVKVLDFGISKAPLSAKEKALTSEAALMGSPAYMSPEQMRASRDVDPRSDIWSMGVVLHELLTRSLPFPGDNVATLITSTLHEPHVTLRAARSDAPGALQKVLDRCLEKEVKRRFADVAELAQALIPFGPPRGNQSLERIMTVLGKHGAVGVDGGLRPAPQGGQLPGGLHISTDPTVAVTGALPAGTPTLSPTSRAAPERAGRRLLIPGFVLGALVVGGIAVAALRGHGSGVAGTIAVDAPSADAHQSSLPTTSATMGVPQTPRVATAAVAPSAEPTTSAAVAVASATASATVAVIASAPPAVTGRTSALTGAALPKPPPPPPPPPTPVVVPAPPPPPKPACKVVSYFDAEGVKHFRQECP